MDLPRLRTLLSRSRSAPGAQPAARTDVAFPSCGSNYEPKFSQKEKFDVDRINGISP